MPDLETLRAVCEAMHERDRDTRHRMLHTIFDGYNASSDFPGFAFVDDLLDMYPSCKVVLNKRHSAQAWETSVRASLRFFSTGWYYLLTYWSPQSNLHYRLYSDYKRLAKRRFGVDDIFTTACYERHNQWVHAVAAARGKEVLEWEPEDGWEALCRFLGRETPEQPFPRLNESAEIATLKAVLGRRGLWAWARMLGAVAVFAASVMALYRWWQ